MTFDDLVPMVRSALGVNSSYEADKIPNLMLRAINRLLRDYNFPKSVVRTVFAAPGLGTTNFALPAGFKRELEVRLFDPSDSSWSDPLTKMQGFQLPTDKARPYGYWFEGTNVVLETGWTGDMAGFDLVLWSQTMDADTHKDWICNDFPDAVYFYSVTKGSPEFRKPEVMQQFAQLWQDERQSLAIYLNELEWNNAEIYMREAQPLGGCRYPA